MLPKKAASNVLEAAFLSVCVRYYLTELSDRLFARNLFVGSFFNLKFVPYLKDIGYLAGRHVSEITVGLIGNNSFQCNAAVLDDDVDRRSRPRGIPEKR